MWECNFPENAYNSAIGRKRQRYIYHGVAYAHD